LAIENVSVDGSKSKISADGATEIINAAPSCGDAADVTDLKAYRWFYLEAKE